jgi:hypothetical protein
MLEKKKSNFAKFLMTIIKWSIIIWTFYLLTFLILDEMYKDKINCQDKNPDNCDITWYNNVRLTWHPFNFNRYQLGAMTGGYINLGLILVIIILSCINLFSSNTHITLEYKDISFILITIICLIYHIVKLVSSL